MQVGDIVDGRFRLLDLLGEGAAGKVFRAEDLGKGRMLVALKLLHAKDPRWENFFRREFEVLSRLHHPNLVRVYDFGAAPEENTWYFTQELVIGKPLLEAVAGKKIDEVLGLFIEICRALEFIHGHGVLHRDLKPANILVQQHADPGERVRVLDFGLWRELDPTPQRGARWAGTPPYLASEVLRGYGHSISADLYAVGITLYQVITRKLPHGRGTPQELLAARKTPAPRIEDVKQELAILVERMIDEDPAKRPASAAEVASQLSMLIPNHVLAMPLTLGRSRLCGRQAEWQKIIDAVQAVRERRPSAPRLLVVEGPDGIGKSRLVSELKAEIQLQSGRAAIGACSEDVRWGYRPIAEWAQALAPAPHYGNLPPREKRAIERLSQTSIDAETSTARGEKERLQQSIVDALLTIAKQQFTLLIVEDVPWSDVASLAVICEAVRRAKECDLVVVATAARPAGAASAVPPALLQAAGPGGALFLRLEPLGHDDVQKLVAALLGVPAQDLPFALVDTLMAQSSGNPLLIEEGLALMIEREEIKRGDRGWKLDEFQSKTASGAVLGILNERLLRLGDIERRTLSALAVLNQPSGPKLLSAICGVGVAEVRQALSVCEGHGLLRIVGDDGGRPRMAFRHPQIREALIDELRQGGVLEPWHRACAVVLEERTGAKASALSETLAYHYEQAGMVGPALRWTLVAAERSIGKLSFEEAVDLSRQAIKLAQKAGADVTAAVKADVFLGQSLFCLGRIPEARAFLENAVLRADAVRAPAAFGELHLWLGRACAQMGALDQGRVAVDRGLQLLPENTQPVAAARLWVARGELNQRVAPLVAWREAERALHLLASPQAGNVAALDHIGAHEVLTNASFYAGDRERSIAYARHRLALAEQQQLILEQITAHRHLARALSSVGSRLEARNHLNMALRLARESAYRVEEALLLKSLGDEVFVSGAIDDAIARYQQATALSAQLGQQGDRADALKALGSCYLAKGEYDRAIDHLKAAIDAFEHASQGPGLASARCVLAHALLAKNLPQDAESVLTLASANLPEVGLADVRAELSCAQGFLQMVVGDFQKSRRFFLRAAALCHQSSEKYVLAHALVGYSQLLLRHNLPIRAWRMAKKAETLYVAIDARGQLRRIKPLLNATEGLSAQRRRMTQR